MGDPKKRRKKFARPSHPWIKARVESERELAITAGLKNKKEIWRISSKLKNFKDQLKKLLASNTPQAESELKLLKEKMVKLGLISENSTPDDILALTLDGLMERRLQTIVVKKMLARSPKQARQFITHKHITVMGKKVTSPNYLVRVNEEDSVSFAENSELSNPDHPERFVEKLTPEEKEEIGAEKPKEEKKPDRRDNRRDKRRGGNRRDFGKQGGFNKGNRRPPRKDSNDKKPREEVKK